MKKNIIILLLLVLIAFPLISQDTKPEITSTKLTGNIYKLTAPGALVVSVFALIGDEGVFLVDAGLQANGEALRAEIKKLSDKPVKYIALTHYHNDHTGANALFGKEGKFIAHKNVLKSLTSAEYLLQPLPKEALPSILVEKEMKIEFGSESIKFIPAIGSHTSGDMIILFEKAGIAVLGDLLFPDKFPFIDMNHGGDVDKYFSTMNSFLEKYPDNTLFVSAHGRDYKKNDIIKYRDDLLKTVTLIKNGLKDGKTIKELEDGDILKDWNSLESYFIPKNTWIETIYSYYKNNGKPQNKMIFDTLITVSVNKDVKSAIETYHELKKNQPDNFVFAENQINALGYALLGAGRVKDAISIFILNVEEYPNSANTYDSLGEAYMTDGNKELAIKNYKKSLELNPQNDNAAKMIEKMSK
jgi:cyclase